MWAGRNELWHVAEWLGRRTPGSCLKLRRAEGREFDPRPGPGQ